MPETRQRKCCPKCKSTMIRYRTATRKYTCEDCRFEFFRNAVGYKEMPIHNTIPKGWQEIAAKKAAKKAAAGEVTA